MSQVVTKAEAQRRKQQSARDKAAAARSQPVRRAPAPPRLAAVAPLPRALNKQRRAPSHPYVNLVLDPFNTKDWSDAGLPDGYTAPSSVLKIRDTVLLASNASGYGALCVFPKLDNMFSTATFTGTAFTSWGSSVAHEKQTLVASECVKMRFIAQGVRVTYAGAPLSATGRVVVLPLVGLASGDISTTVTDWVDAPNAVEATCQELPIEYHMAPFDPPPFQASTVTFNSYFPGVCIGILGGEASKTLLSIEVVTYLEILPYTTSLNAHTAKPHAAHPAALAAAANSTSIGPHIVTDAPKVMAWKRAAVDATFAALGLVGEYYGAGPVAGLLPMLPDAYRRTRRATNQLLLTNG